MNPDLTSLPPEPFALFTPRFRGQIYEDDVDNELLKDFLKVKFNRKILRDALLPTTRRQGLRAANQIGKSETGYLIFKHFLKHMPADMIMYDMTDQKSADQMRNRFMRMIRRIPAIAAEIAKVVKDDRWAAVTQGITFPGMVFRARGLNETWVQSFPVRFGMISDAALVGNNGLVQKAFVRSRQYEKNDFWYVESQGGVVLPDQSPGDDFVRFMQTTNDMKLWVRCPSCSTRQRFVFSTTRDEMTKIVPPLSVPSLDHAAWLEINRPLLLSDERRFAGFKHADGVAKENQFEIGRTTYYECPHCGGRWNDSPATREYLDNEASLDENWIATRPGAMPGYLGYSLPAWINPKISWGSCMVNFKAAMEAKGGGNILPLQHWKQKWEGEDWDDRMGIEKTVTISPGSYDPAQLAELIANAHSVDMAVDCQVDMDHKAQTGAQITGWFWYVVRVFSKNGDSKQLARGFCKSWDAWREVQHHWKIPNDRVVIDFIFDPEGVVKRAIQYREVRKLDKPNVFRQTEITVTWKLLVAGNKVVNYIHADKITRAWSPEMKAGGYVLDEKTGSRRWIDVPKIAFNKTPIMLQVDALYTKAQGMPQFEVLSREFLRLPNGEPDTLTLEMEAGNRTYEKQMAAQLYDMQKGKYVEMHPDDHYYWCEQALVVRAGKDGLLSHLLESN